MAVRRIAVDPPSNGSRSSARACLSGHRYRWYRMVDLAPVTSDEPTRKNLHARRHGFAGGAAAVVGLARISADPGSLYPVVDNQWTCITPPISARMHPESEQLSDSPRQDRDHSRCSETVGFRARATGPTDSPKYSGRASDPLQIAVRGSRPRKIGPATPRNGPGSRRVKKQR